MTVQIKKQHPALKHAGFSATRILPGESAAEFEKLHRELIAELTPCGMLETEIVATMAHLLWRRKNLATFRIAERAQQRLTQIRNAMIPMDYAASKSDKSDDFDKTFTENWRAAESKARDELGELYGLVEMGEDATLDCLIKELAVQERLDAMLDKCVRRLLFVRGLKSMSLASTSAPPERLPRPSSAA